MKLLNQYKFKQQPAKNLGTFNTHQLSPGAQEIFTHYSAINGVDEYAYPELKAIKSYCGEFLLNLFNANNPKEFESIPTSGSSEAIFLSLATLKKRSKAKRPNFIISQQYHVSWKKAADLLNIELRIINAERPSAYLNYIDANTIGVGCILGTTTTLVFEDIASVNTLLEEYFIATGQFIPIHVDAASGGFIAPFAYPELKWDFKLSHVFAINVSSHKYGLVYPSLGWLTLRKLNALDEMTHHSDYLGQATNRIPLQFSHSAAHLMTQYYQFQTVGLNGYRTICAELFALTSQLKQALSQIPGIEIKQSLNLPTLPGLVFGHKTHSLNELAAHLKNYGWSIPVYQDPKSQQPVSRIVIRHGFTQAHLDELVSVVKEYVMAAQMNVLSQ